MHQLRKILVDCGVVDQNSLADKEKNAALAILRRRGWTVPDEWTMQKHKAQMQQGESSPRPLASQPRRMRSARRRKPEAAHLRARVAASADKGQAGFRKGSAKAGRGRGSAKGSAKGKLRSKKPSPPRGIVAAEPEIEGIGAMVAANRGQGEGASR